MRKMVSAHEMASEYQREEAAIREWMQHYPPGTRVELKMGSGAVWVTRTAGNPWMNFKGQAVIRLEGRLEAERLGRLKIADDRQQLDQTVSGLNELNERAAG